MEFKDYVNVEWKICYLNIRVVPNSRITSFIEAMSDWALKIRLKSVPENGKANEELVKFISNQLNIKTSKVTIISWLTIKNKLVKIDF
jgi:uncharacterized protein YggU (UPF0235/DUF167 family)